MPVVKKYCETLLGFNYVKVERNYLSKDESSETGNGGKDGGASKASSTSGHRGLGAVGTSAAKRLLAMVILMSDMFR